MPANLHRILKTPRTRQREEQNELPERIEQAVEQGKLFIPLEERLEEEDVPDGYMQQSIALGRDAYTALLPERVMRYLGYPEEATDELFACYQEIRKFENGRIAQRQLNAAESYFAHGVKNAYETYVLNQLLTGGGKLKETYEKAFGREKKHMEALLALLGCRTTHSLKELEDILVHITNTTIKVVEQVPEQVEREEKVYRTVTRMVTHEIRCDCGSHYEWRTVTENQTTMEYAGTRTVVDTIIKNVLVDKEVALRKERQFLDLEKEVTGRLFSNGGTEKDPNINANLLRAYLNMHLEKEGKTRLPMKYDMKEDKK